MSTSSNKKIGLVLSGGGARGFAHVGVLKVLEQHGIRFDLIAGTSAGSIVGGALASGMNAAEIEAMARRISWLNTIRPTLPFRGLLSTAPIGRFLARELPVTRFEDLPTPFAAVAFDLAAGREVVFSGSGDLIHAIRASCSVPLLFAPVRDSEGRVLVDGGVTSVMPVDVMRSMGADIVIAVDLIACGGVYPRKPRNVVSIGVRSALTLIRTASGSQTSAADVVIIPQIAHLRPDQLSKRDEFIALGEAAAGAAIDEIIALTQ
jgi:NTE family protein